jgi:metal-sulfur cluster biosynthetic enzyme
MAVTSRSSNPDSTTTMVAHDVAGRQTQFRSGPAPTASGYGTPMVTKDDVVEALHSVEDPELGMDIVELGLFYDTEIEGPRVKVVHSLTSMGCPAGPMIQESIHEAVAALPGVEQVDVELTFDPPWTPDLMSDDAKFILGFG